MIPRQAMQLAARTLNAAVIWTLVILVVCVGLIAYGHGYQDGAQMATETCVDVFTGVPVSWK